MIINNKEYDFFKRPYTMGILNVTPDSFSDGGKYNTLETAFSRAVNLIQDGADIIDIGGESSKPGASPVSCEEELSRVVPIIKKIRSNYDIPISIDTTKSEVAQNALDAGANIVNDISGLNFDEHMVDIVAQAQCPICIMHMKGTPKTMQKNPVYDNVIGEIKLFFKKQINYAVSKGISKKNIILDPGIGFGKRVEDNLIILNRFMEFKEFGCPMLIGPSRKSFIGAILDNRNVDERLYGTLGSIASAVNNGANILRVHDVRATNDMLAVMNSIYKEHI